MAKEKALSIIKQSAIALETKKSSCRHHSLFEEKQRRTLDQAFILRRNHSKIGRCYFELIAHNVGAHMARIHKINYPKNDSRPKISGLLFFPNTIT